MEVFGIKGPPSGERSIQGAVFCARLKRRACLVLQRFTEAIGLVYAARNGWVK
jgi:hypothetical protein